MNKQKLWKAAFAFAGSLIVGGIFAGVIADENKKIPDHSGFQACEPCHAEKHRMWEASGHSRAISRVANNNQASTNCYGCHSSEGFAARLQGKKVETAQKQSFHTISCLACHNPRNGEHPRKLVMDPEKLCTFCHSQQAVLKGQGAKGVEETRFVHSAIPCVSCHMTEGNHLMKVLRPDDPNLSEKHTDTCTACHKDNNRKARARQIQDWQAWYKESMDPLQADLKLLDAEVKENPDLFHPGLKVKLNDVKANLAILERDGSRGAHNLDYALEIMALAAKDLKELKASVQ